MLLKGSHNLKKNCPSLEIKFKMSKLKLVKHTQSICTSIKTHWISTLQGSVNKILVSVIQRESCDQCR